MFLLAFLLVLTGIIYYGLNSKKKKFTYWRRKGIAQQDGQHLLYGDVKGLFQRKKQAGELSTEIYYKFKKMGVQHGGYYMMSNPQWLLIHPSIIRLVMTKDFQHFSAHNPKLSDSLLFNNIFHMDGEPWKDIRRKLSPTFTSGKMKMVFDMLLEKTHGLSDLMASTTKDGKASEIKTLLARFTTDVIGTCGFGIECDSLNNENSQFFQQGQELFKRFMKRPKFITSILILLGVLSPFRFDVTDIEDFFRQIVNKTVDYREKNKVVRKDFLHLMIQLKNKGSITDIINEKDVCQTNGEGGLSMEEVAGQCLLFFTAGFETSSTTMPFALLELAHNQDIQAKLREEIPEVLKKYNGNLTYEALQDMTYCENVMQETLRKYPPLANLTRLCTKDYRIPDTDIVIDKGTNVNIPIIALHNDPEYFPDPQKFMP
uniref:Cytochrome P450 monooxygenase CYP6BX8 n=1 Tax=Euwallacea interjectus TaxID=321055 RepID=A0A9Y1YYK6_9CUCU|nr:cytochrome P450 monooxygenase CYP6BX8 [Euwallacea interjectus]